MKMNRIEKMHFRFPFHVWPNIGLRDRFYSPNGIDTNFGAISTRPALETVP